MQKEFLEEVITLIVGKPGKELVVLLAGKKNVNEFIIAKKLDMTINQTRNLLYRLSDYGLVSSIRKKDKKKGWYTYFWKIEILKSLEFLKTELTKKLTQLNSQIKSRETKLFYVCDRCNIEFTEENALLHDFTCSECGEVFKVKDNSKLLREFKKNMEKIKSDLDSLEKEIGKEKENEEKKRVKESKKQNKIKEKDKIAIREKKKLITKEKKINKPKKDKKNPTGKKPQKKPAQKISRLKKTSNKIPKKVKKEMKTKNLQKKKLNTKKNTKK
jgi:transcription factor E